MLDYLDLLQRINNLLYWLLGDHDIVIGLQVYINNERHELDLHDRNELIEDDYVQ